MRFLKGGVLAAALLVVNAIFNPSPAAGFNEPRLEMLFSEGRARNWVEVLTSPEYAGRGSDDAGYMQAAQLVADELQRLGFLPLDQSFVVPFSWTRVESSAHTGGYALKTVKHRTANVMGWIPGSTKEVIVIGAHLDHLGHKKDDRSVYAPGADDNASGVAAVLEVARALKAYITDGNAYNNLTPKRSIVVAFWGAEEQGLIGSGFFVDRLMSDKNPYPFTLKDIMTVVNLDMVGRGYTGEEDDNKPKTVTVVGTPGTPTDTLYEQKNPVLYKLLIAHMNKPEINLKLKYDEGKNHYFLRSDQYSFFKVNNELATLFLTGPEHPDYHGISDTADKLDYNRLVRISRFVYNIVEDLITTDEYPRCILCG